MKGKVVLTFDYTAAGDSARNLEVTVGENTKKTPVSDKTTHNYEQEIDAGSGTDIYIGADNNFWVKELKITENKATFASATNSDTANNLVTLGLVGTKATSSADGIATAEIKDGKIAITSVAAGNAEITVTDKNDKTAKIPVTVKSSGEVEVGTITKFTRSKPTATITKQATGVDAADAEGTVEWDGLTDLEYSLDGEDFEPATTAGINATVEGTTATITDITAGTYYVRGAASADYEATAAASVTVTVEGAATTYTLLPSDIIDWTTAKTQLTDITTDGAKFQAGAGVTYDASKIGVPSIKLGGSTQKAGKNCIVLTTTSDNVTVTVKFAANGSSATDGRHIVAIAGTDTSAVNSGSVTEGAIEDTVNVPTESNGIVTASITLPTAGTYSIGGTNGIYITEVSLTM